MCCELEWHISVPVLWADCAEGGRCCQRKCRDLCSLCCADARYTSQKAAFNKTTFFAKRLDLSFTKKLMNCCIWNIAFYGAEIWTLGKAYQKYLKSVDKKNQLDVTFCILYFSSNSCSTCFGQPYAHHQELTTA